MTKPLTEIEVKYLSAKQLVVLKKEHGIDLHAVRNEASRLILKADVDDEGNPKVDGMVVEVEFEDMLTVLEFLYTEDAESIANAKSLAVEKLFMATFSETFGRDAEKKS